MNGSTQRHDDRTKITRYLGSTVSRREANCNGRRVACCAAAVSLISGSIVLTVVLTYNLPYYRSVFRAISCAVCLIVTKQHRISCDVMDSDWFWSLEYRYHPKKIQLEKYELLGFVLCGEKLVMADSTGSEIRPRKTKLDTFHSNAHRPEIPNNPEITARRQGPITTQTENERKRFNIEVLLITRLSS